MIPPNEVYFNIVHKHLQVRIYDRPGYHYYALHRIGSVTKEVTPGHYDCFQLGKPSNRKSPEFSGIFPNRGGGSQKKVIFPTFLKLLLEWANSSRNAKKIFSIFI